MIPQFQQILGAQSSRSHAAHGAPDIANDHFALLFAAQEVEKLVVGIGTAAPINLPSVIVAELPAAAFTAPSVPEPLFNALLPADQHFQIPQGGEAMPPPERTAEDSSGVGWDIALALVAFAANTPVARSANLSTAPDVPHASDMAESGSLSAAQVLVSPSASTQAELQPESLIAPTVMQLRNTVSPVGRSEHGEASSGNPDQVRRPAAPVPVAPVPVAPVPVASVPQPSQLSQSDALAEARASGDECTVRKPGLETRLSIPTVAPAATEVSLSSAAFGPALGKPPPPMEVLRRTGLLVATRTVPETATPQRGLSGAPVSDGYPRLAPLQTGTLVEANTHLFSPGMAPPGTVLVLRCSAADSTGETTGTGPTEPAPARHSKEPTPASPSQPESLPRVEAVPPRETTPSAPAEAARAPRQTTATRIADSQLSAASSAAGAGDAPAPTLLVAKPAPPAGKALPPAVSTPNAEHLPLRHKSGESAVLLRLEAFPGRPVAPENRLPAQSESTETAPQTDSLTGSIPAGDRLPAADVSATAEPSETTVAKPATDLIGPATPKRAEEPLPASVSPAPKATVAELPTVWQHNAAAAAKSPVEVLLNPEGLGRLRFEMHQHGEQLSIVLAIERPETQDLLRRHADQLMAEFRQAGYSGATLSFGQWGRGQSSATPDPTPEPPPPAGEEPEPRQLRTGLHPANVGHQLGQGLNLRL